MTTMEKSAVFNLKRFLGLIGTGVFRSKISIAAMMIWLITFWVIILFCSLTMKIANVEMVNYRNIIICIYQISYILILSFSACYTAIFKQKKMEIWRRLPASGFEKELFLILRILVFDTLAFIIAFFCFDHIFWALTQGTDTRTQYCISLSELFTFAQGVSGAPAWVNYILTFFYFTCTPAIVNSVVKKADLASTRRTIFPSVVVWLFALYIGSMLNHNQVFEFQIVIIASLSLFAWIFPLILALFASRRVVRQQ